MVGVYGSLLLIVLMWIGVGVFSLKAEKIINNLPRGWDVVGYISYFAVIILACIVTGAFN